MIKSGGNANGPEDHTIPGPVAGMVDRQPVPIKNQSRVSFSGRTTTDAERGTDAVIRGVADSPRWGDWVYSPRVHRLPASVPDSLPRTCPGSRTEIPR